MQHVLNQVEPLSDHFYMQSHLAWRRASNQQQRMLAWLERFVADSAHPGDRIRVLSIGCGTGILDTELMRMLTARYADVAFVGIDPNSEECAAFLDKMQPWQSPQVRVSVHPIKFEDYTSAEPFDLILGVHVMYYFAQPEQVLEKMHGLLSGHGCGVILNAPDQPLSLYFSTVMQSLYGIKPALTPDLEQALTCLALPYRVETIHAEADVTPCLQPGDTAETLLSFIIHGDMRALPDADKQTLKAHLAGHTRLQRARHYIQHNVDALILGAPPRMTETPA